MRWTRKGIWEKGVKQVNTDVGWMVRARCTFNGHLWEVEQFDIATHRMLLMCNRCGNRRSTTVGKVKLSEDNTPQADKH